MNSNCNLFYHKKTERYSSKYCWREGAQTILGGSQVPFYVHTWHWDTFTNYSFWSRPFRLRIRYFCLSCKYWFLDWMRKISLLQNYGQLQRKEWKKGPDALPLPLPIIFPFKSWHEKTTLCHFKYHNWFFCIVFFSCTHLYLPEINKQCHNSHFIRRTRTFANLLYNSKIRITRYI